MHICQWFPTPPSRGFWTLINITMEWKQKYIVKFKIQYNMVYTIQCSFVKFKRIPRTWAWGVFWKYNFNLPFGDDNLSFGSVRGCLHDTGTSFIVLQYLISYRVCMGVIVPNWYNVLCEPSFLQAILEHSCLSTHIGLPIPVNSATHLTPEQNLVPPLHDTST